MSLKILSADIVTSGSAAVAPGQLRDELAHFAFTGRSNVGKSSLLNALVRRKIVRTSAAAGKTRLANVFRVDAEGGAGGPGRWSSYLVDLPGYGYARGGEESAKELAAVVDTYFQSASDRRGAVFLLVDSRHPGIASDLDAHRWLSTAIRAPILVATKIDKLSRAERTHNLRAFEQAFATPALPVSALNGEGVAELWNVIAGLARP